MSAAHLPLDPPISVVADSEVHPRDLDQQETALINGKTHITPRDAHEAIGNQAASIVENHNTHVTTGVNKLIENLHDLVDQLTSDAREVRAVIDRHTHTARTVEELTIGIQRALKSREESR